MLFDDSDHPLYRAAEAVLQKPKGTTRQQLRRLIKCFKRKGLQIPTDLAFACNEAGVPIDY